MTLNGSGPVAATTATKAREVDQLGSSIASENNASANTTQALLINMIKAHIAQGDKATQKANDHYVSAGQYLKELKGDLSQAEFLEIVREKIGIGKTRTYELLAIADGTKTTEQVRDQTNTRKIKHRQSVRSGTDNVDDREIGHTDYVDGANGKHGFATMLAPDKKGRKQSTTHAATGDELRTVRMEIMLTPSTIESLDRYRKTLTYETSRQELIEGLIEAWADRFEYRADRAQRRRAPKVTSWPAR